MKLVYLSTLRLPTRNAHGFQIMNMCAAFAEKGVEVLLLVPWRKNLLKTDPFDFYQVHRSFKIKKLFAIDLYPLRFIPERVSGFLHLLSFLITARIYLFFKSFDVLYTRENFSRFFFKNYIYEIHMPEQVKFGIFRPKKIIAISNHIRNELMKLGFSDKNILVAPDAVNLALFSNMNKEEARRQLKLPLDKKIVMYWGNFKMWKGIDTLAEAVKYLNNFFVVMVGATKETDLARIKMAVKDYNNVLVEGFKNQDLLPTYLASADVLVLPNTAKDENSRLFTSPLKLFEYMASGRPIVASDLPSLREILNDKNAVFFKPDDPESLSRAIEDIARNESKRESIANQARKDVEKYTWDNRAKSIVNFINQK